MTDTIFGRILSGDIPADLVYEDEHCIAINDINPQAPVHILLIPRKAIDRLADAGQEDQALLGHLMLAAAKIAREQGIGEGFRLIVNNGKSAGQTVFHLHLHLVGGKQFSEGLV